MKEYLKEEYLKQNMMGPNAIILIDELIKDLDISQSERILDLGCGTGLTSMFLADRFPALVFAMDLWIPASENFARFAALGLDKRIIPIHADANSETFADEYFDAVISVDSYHYYGNNEAYLDNHLAPLIKKDGIIALCFPGLKKELDYLPEEMALSWPKEALDTLHSCDWWRDILSQSKMVDIVSISEMSCFEKSWNDWLSCDNPYAVSDRPAMEAGAGKYMNLISVICRKK